MDNVEREGRFAYEGSDEDRSDKEARNGYGPPGEVRNPEDVHGREGYHEDTSDEVRYVHGRRNEDRNRYRESASFERIYQCYPPIYIDKSELEIGNKIIMLPSALSRLSYQEIQYPMLFQLENTITDLEVDFALPLDYSEPERLQVNPATLSTATTSKRIGTNIPSAEHVAEFDRRFTAFTGIGRRPNGKPVSPKSPRVKSPRSRSPSRAPMRKSGKLVFGDNTNQTHAYTKETVKVAGQKNEKETEEAEKFQPFTGKKYSLKD
ncbi:hypothetical protein SUGI_0722210 [Cryptomeria japonica]|nr:hypothetical protein SUGI_0722210 [Cryptomeria japonica]